MRIFDRPARSIKPTRPAAVNAGPARRMRPSSLRRRARPTPATGRCRVPAPTRSVTRALEQNTSAQPAPPPRRPGGVVVQAAGRHALPGRPAHAAVRVCEALDAPMAHPAGRGHFPPLSGECGPVIKRPLPHGCPAGLRRRSGVGPTTRAMPCSAAQKAPRLLLPRSLACDITITRRSPSAPWTHWPHWATPCYPI